jgi:hypothetical protein
MLLTTCMVFMPSLKAHRAELFCKEIGAAMGRRASQEMGPTWVCLWEYLHEFSLTALVATLHLEALG